MKLRKYIPIVLIVLGILCWIYVFISLYMLYLFMNMLEAVFGSSVNSGTTELSLLAFVVPSVGTVLIFSGFWLRRRWAHISRKP